MFICSYTAKWNVNETASCPPTLILLGGGSSRPILCPLLCEAKKMPLFDDYDGKDNRKCLSVQSSIQTLCVVNNFLPLSKEFNLPLSMFNFLS